MKLLLTSSGLTNKSISNALFELVNKKPEDTSLVFIPTASNIEQGDKDWFINDLINLKKQNFKSIDIADISAIDKEIWKPKFEEADVLFFEGGNTHHLMKWINKSGLKEMIPEFLETKVYVGVSAGSMVTSKDLMLETSKIIYGEDLDETEEIAGLNLVDFYLLPHLNNEYFTNVREGKIKETIKDIDKKVYAIDDQSALKVIDGVVEVVSEGEWFIL